LRAVGHDVDGRQVSYDEEHRTFAVAGVPIGLGQFARYARKGLVIWATPELRAWFDDWDKVVLAEEARATALEPEPSSAAPQSAQTVSAAFRRARGIGSEGERRVSKALRSGADATRWGVLDDVLLRAGKVTAQIDHVVVDPQGIVLVETKTLHATIMGREADSHWTACYGKGRNKRFQNPLAQNRYHESILLNASSKAGVRILPDYFTSLVVFVDSRLDRLELRTETGRNVIEVSEVPRWCGRRRAATAEAPHLSQEQVQLVTQWLGSLDQSSSDEVQTLHQEYREKKRQR
jgi:hypothetical protein